MQNLPVVDLKYRQASVLRQLLLLVLRRVRMLQFKQRKTINHEFLLGASKYQNIISWVRLCWRIGIWKDLEKHGWRMVCTRETREAI